MKITIGEWLEMLDEPYRCEALEHCDILDEYADDLHEAVHRCGLWLEMPSGFVNWDNYVNETIPADCNPECYMEWKRKEIVSKL